MNKEEFFKNIKVGDEVMTQSGFTCKLTTVTSLTGIYINTADGKRYYRKTGTLVGDGHFHSRHIKPFSKQEIDEYLLLKEAQTRFRDMVNKLRAIGGDDVLKYISLCDEFDNIQNNKN